MPMGNGVIGVIGRSGCLNAAGCFAAGADASLAASAAPRFSPLDLAAGFAFAGWHRFFASGFAADLTLRRRGTLCMVWEDDRHDGP